MIFSEKELNNLEKNSTDTKSFLEYIKKSKRYVVKVSSKCSRQIISYTTYSIKTNTFIFYNLFTKETNNFTEYGFIKYVLSSIIDMKRHSEKYTIIEEFDK